VRDCSRGIGSLGHLVMPAVQVLYLSLNCLRVLRTRPISGLIQLLAPCASFLVLFAIIRVRAFDPPHLTAL
jgi:hypothetical protein